MNSPHSVTSRRAECPRCHTPRFEYCVDLAGNCLERSHPERVAAAKLESDLTPAMYSTLQRLHLDPQRALHPTVRDCLLKRGLILEMDPPLGPTGKKKLSRELRRRFPLTEAGRMAIGVAEQGVRAS